MYRVWKLRDIHPIQDKLSFHIDQDQFNRNSKKWRLHNNSVPRILEATIHINLQRTKQVNR